MQDHCLSEVASVCQRNREQPTRDSVCVKAKLLGRLTQSRIGADWLLLGNSRVSLPCIWCGTLSEGMMTRAIRL